MIEMGMAVKPFSLDFPVEGKMGRLFSMVKRPLEKLLWLDNLNHIYAQTSCSDSHRAFFQRVLERLNTRARVSQVDLDSIPRTGPLVVVANHPFGAIEGILLASLLESVRPDVRVMGNYLLHRIPELRELFIFVDPFGGKEAARANIRGLRQSIEYVENGGVLAIFPAGTVSHLDIKRREVTDPQWSDNVARIVRRTGAAVLPVFFEGTNSALFQFAGLVHPKLRTAMIPREVFNKRRGTIKIRIGRVIPFNKLKQFDDDREMTENLRRRTYLLRYRDQLKPTPAISATPVSDVRPQPIITAVDPALLAREIAALPHECRIVDGGENQVIAAWAGQLPHVMREIGRLREITFRLTGEGTGKAIDLDEFDPHYLHLFVWNQKTSQIISAYRLGLTDKILAERGVGGLYTSTLFHFKPAMLRQLNPAIELGRSFVRPEYQRSFSPLMLLWKGIGQILVRNPQYRLLFGPVSISNTYNTISRQLMVTFLQMHNFLPDLSKLVKARNPFNMKKPSALAGGDIDEVSDLVSEIEADQKGIPVLIKQYLKLGGQILGFNVDPNFSDVVDGLVYVDMGRTDRRVLEKYMGREAAGDFLKFHGQPAATALTAPAKRELVEV